VVSLISKGPVGNGQHDGTGATVAQGYPPHRLFLHIQQQLLHVEAHTLHDAKLSVFDLLYSTAWWNAGHEAVAIWHTVQVVAVRVSLHTCCMGAAWVCVGVLPHSTSCPYKKHLGKDGFAMHEKGGEQC
jgi:hypothetical protein